MCPVMIFFIIASIYQIWHIKNLEKTLAKLEFLKKAQKIAKKNLKKILTQDTEMAKQIVVPVMPLIQKKKPV